MNRKLIAASSIAVALTLGLSACGSSSDGADETTTTTPSSDTTDADSSTTTEKDSGSTTTEEYEPSGEKTVYGGVDIVISEAELRPADVDEGEPEDTTTLTVTLALENSTDEASVAYGLDDIDLVVGDENIEAGYFPGDNASFVSLKSGDTGDLEVDFYDVPSDMAFDDATLLIAETDKVPAVLPFSGSAESPLPVKTNPAETFQIVDQTDAQFDVVIDEVTRTWDLTTDDLTSSAMRAERGTTFLRLDMTVTAGSAQVCVGRDDFRLESAGEVTPAIAGSHLNECVGANTQANYIAYLVLPDDAADAIVRLGDPSNDPAYTEWPVPLDELGGEIDIDTIIEEITSGEASGSSSSGDEDDTTTTTKD